jgi:hypothetical protein
MVLGAKPVSGAAPVAAAVHRAGSQRPAASHRRTGIGEEVAHRRVAALDGVEFIHCE